MFENIFSCIWFFLKKKMLTCFEKQIFYSLGGEVSNIHKNEAIILKMVDIIILR